MPVLIERATPAQVDESSRVIATALADDAVVRAMVPGSRDRLSRLSTLYAATLRVTLRIGVVDVARLRPGESIVGVASWHRPGGARGSAWRQLRELPVGLRVIGLRHVPSVLLQVARYARARPRTPHWYLEDIGTLPAARGQGVGTSLLRHRLAVVDTDGLPAYLESTTRASQRLYERLGFRPIGEIPVRDAVAIAMLRPARR